jgi:hypothetical protein
MSKHFQDAPGSCPKELGRDSRVASSDLVVTQQAGRYIAADNELPIADSACASDSVTVASTALLVLGRRRG